MYDILTVILVHLYRMPLKNNRGRNLHVCHSRPAMTLQSSRTHTHTHVTRVTENTPSTVDLLAGDSEGIFSLQLAATFHSVRLISDAKACPLCEIAVVSALLLAGASHGNLTPCWKERTAHTECRYSLNVLMLHSKRSEPK